jgi:hypothetical protein
MPGIEKFNKKRCVEDNTPPPDPHNRVVCDQVVAGLGKPPEFARCAASRIHTGTYRVNVWVRNNYTEALTDSFWIKVDENGRIVNSTPAIVKKYQIQGIE